MPRFNSINFYQNGPKVKLFLPKRLPKIKFFFRKTKSAPRSPTSGSWGLHLQTLQTAPPSLQIPGYQTRRHEGANRGRALPTDCLCPQTKIVPPPKRGLCPEEINRLVASGAQIEVQISVFWGLTPDFVTFLG